jgi:hypothetical protein
MAYLKLEIKRSRRSTIVSTYDVEIRRGGKLVIVHERADNKGRSITNNAERVLTTIVRNNDLITKDTVFVEHYPERGDIEPTWDQIIPTWCGDTVVDVTWRPLGKKIFELLKGNFQVLEVA